MGIIQAGSYRARGIAAAAGKSSLKGTLCVTVTLRLEDGPHNGELIDWVGWMSDATRARTAESLDLLGFDGDDLATACANEVTAVIEHEEFVKNNGEVLITPRVKWINDTKRGGAKFAALSPGETQALMGSLRGYVLAAKAARGASGNGAGNGGTDGSGPRF